MLGVSKGAISQWISRAEKEGVEALRRHPAPGPIPKLTGDHCGQLPDLLSQGAEALGFRGQVWTMKRVAQMIECTFGVRDHRAHCSRILRAQKQS